MIPALFLVISVVISLIRCQEAYFVERPCKLCYTLVEHHRSDPGWMTSCTISCNSEWKEQDCPKLCAELKKSPESAQVLCPPICARALETGHKSFKDLADEDCASSEQVQQFKKQMDELLLENERLHRENSQLSIKTEGCYNALKKLEQLVREKEIPEEPVKETPVTRPPLPHEPVHIPEPVPIPEPFPLYEPNEFKPIVEPTPIVETPKEEKQSIEPEIEKNISSESEKPEERIFFPEPQPVRHDLNTYPLLTVLVLGATAALFRYFLEQAVEAKVDQLMEEGNFQMGVFFPVLIDILISIGVIGISVLCLGGGILSNLLFFGLSGFHPDMSGFVWVPFLLGYFFGVQIYVFQDLVRAELKRKAPMPHGVLQIFHSVVLALFSFIVAWNFHQYQSSDPVALCLIFLVYEVEILAKKGFVGLVQKVDIPFTLNRVQQFLHLWGIIQLAMLWRSAHDAEASLVYLIFIEIAIKAAFATLFYR